ncbi:hypothetical protein AB0M00_43865 [Streptomyces chartreusis]|uniref:hypothetical protein n=1 Tax=Streptomyces chartreusis TaxID=1969 RepID=UPI003443B212
MAQATEAPATITAEGPTSHTQNQDLDQLLARLERLEEEKAAAAGTYGYTRQEQMEALHRLREPFPLSEVRYRPQPYCKKCSEAQGWPKVCQNHTEIKCQRCNGQKVTEAHICLKYIGHAEATNRLLNVDPFWNWEPLAFDGGGLPQYDGNRGMWIRMTVCGMTRIGYGDAGNKNGANAVKEIIGDAIRNAGMRFGMALDLWTSSDLEIIESGADPGEQDASGSNSAGGSGQQAPSGPSEHLARLMGQVTDCWKSDKVLIFEQIKSDGAKHKVLDERFTAKDGTVTTLRKVLDGRIAELPQQRSAS